MDDFTQRLLEKKNARKRKQEEASAALKSIDVQSVAKKSPVKNRHPLTPKNENDTVGARLPPVAKPRTDGGFEKKSTPTNRRNGKSPGKDLEEILDSGRKSQIFTHSKQNTNDTHNSKAKAVISDSESVQERVARLRGQSASRDESPSGRSRHGSLSRNNSTESPAGKNDRTPGSISDKLAIFETARNGTTPRGQQSKSSDMKPLHKPRKQSDVDCKYSKDESYSNRLSTKLQKTSTMRENVNKNELYSPLSPKLGSISAGDESCDLDYQSDENPFDVSSILRAANENEPEIPAAAEYTKASWNVNDYLTEGSPKTEVKDNARQRDSVYSNNGADDSLSGFGKEIAKKRNAMKNPGQAENLKKIDSKLNARAFHTAKDEKKICKDVEEAKSVKTSPLKASPVKTSSSIGAKQGRKDEKRKAPRFPGDESSVEYNDSKTKKKKQAGNVDADKVSFSDQRQAPPKPPRKGKLSVEEATDDITMNSVEQDAVRPFSGLTYERSEPMEKPKEEKRKRNNEVTRHDKFGDHDGATVAETVISKEIFCEEERSTKKLKKSGKHAPEVEVEKHSLNEINENQIDDMIFSPNSKTYKSVREKKTTNGRKGMRRSMSFSEGQSPIVPIIHKSGYNEEASSKYNVVTNCGAPVKDEAKSTSDRIKELLDYAVSQQNIVIQASQALNLSLNGEEKRGCPEIIEGERLLLLATQRRTACLDEVEHLKQANDQYQKMKGDMICPPCKAALVISDISLPLNTDFLIALRGGRMDLGVFHFVVLIQHGPTQIYSTKARCTYDELARNYLTFNDRITLKDVSHDFALTVKVFGMHTKRATDVIHRGKKSSQSKESPGLMKNVFSSFTPKRRLNSADDSPVRGSSPKPVFRTTNFTMVGSTTINLINCGAGKFVLNQVPKNCPLDGLIDLKIDCLPEFNASARGFLTLLEEVGGYTAWNRRWCVMQGDLISFWRFPDEENQKPPTATIDMRMCSNKLIDVVPRMECSRPNTFELIVKRPLSKHDTPSLLSTIEGKEYYTKHWVSADNKEDRVAWIEVLNRQLSDSRAWTVKRFKSKEAVAHSAAHASPRKHHNGGAVPV